MSILGHIADVFAHITHPDKPREFFENVVLPTDIPPEESARRLDAAAAKSPQFRNWRTSIKDRMALTHPDDPDGAKSDENLAKLAAECGIKNYSGTYEQNMLLLKMTDKAIAQRGIPLPPA